MSRDIRSFFAPKTLGKGETSFKEKVLSKSKQKKRLILSDSDSDDGSSKHPEVKVSKKKKLSLNKGKEKTNDEKTLKPIKVSDVFGSDHIRRSTEKTVPTPSKQVANKVTVNVKINSNEDSLEGELSVPWDEFDEIESKYWSTDRQHAVNVDSCDSPKKSGEKRRHDQDQRKKKAASESVVLPTKKKKVSTDENSSSKVTADASLPSPSSRSAVVNDKAQSSGTEEVQAEKTPKSKKVRERSDENADSSQKSKKETPKASDQGALSVEKKKEHAMNYIRYLNREGPKHRGSKVIPEGSPNCLEGLVFVITGVLDSLDRDEATELIKKYGGRVTSSLSRNTSYLLVGEDAGPSKLEKAKSFNTKQLDEDGLLNLVVERSTGSGLHSSSKEDTGRKDTEKKSGGNLANKNTKPLNCDSTSVVSVLKVKSNEGTVHHIHSAPASLKNCSQMSSSQNNGNLMINYSTPSLWVEKYRPTSSKQIIGQQGEKSVVKKLSKWLENWYKNRTGGKKFKPSPWAKDDDGSFYKAALISGPPGIGKTTAAHLVSKELGFDIVEFNASDTRSKKLLHDEVTELLSSKSLYGLFHGKDGRVAPSAKHVLIMDEVDGMAGNEDRGGIQELIQLVKSTHIPIICICNDRNHPKIRSLVNYCFDLRVQKPRLEQIRGAMMSVCFKEGLKIPPDALTDVITCANQDIRQVLNNLSMWYVNTKNLSSEEIKTEAQKSKKEFKLGPWDVLRKVFSAEEHKKMSIHDKSDLFFYDYNISPLFVQENYLNVVPTAAAGNIGKTLELISATADSISYGDTIEKAIRSRGSWSLLPMQAMFSSVFPGDYMQGYIKSQINFPSWLGKNSRSNKFDRLSQELHVHMRLAISGSKLDLALDYLPYIRDAIVKPLISEGAPGVPQALSVLKKYYLLREDLESLLELSSWPDQRDPMSMVDSKVKAALTRAYNKEGIMIPYAVHTTVKKKSGASFSEMEGAEGEETLEDVEEEDEETDDIKSDAMIKIAKKKTAAVESASGTSEIKKGKGKGKGKPKQSK
ncbi:replication factor C subunit 1 [Schistocerca cancellata]|uniref:replication factor C subunit 1 n=1 Tax=Schistocerca cancellata TaxID=274614 RepID=UPI0021184237|nr:replication factor C subunit 1 [Schistocerca cancellata]